MGLDEAAKDFQDKIGYQRELKETRLWGLLEWAALGSRPSQNISTM